MSGESSVSSKPDYVLGKRDYRFVRVIPNSWSPLELWGLDLFVWHIPLLKLTLVLDALIVWWLT